MAAALRHVRGGCKRILFEHHQLVKVWATRQGLHTCQVRLSQKSFSRVCSGNHGTTRSILQRHRCVTKLHEQSKYLFGAVAVRWNSSAVKDTPDVSEVVKQLTEHFPEGYIPEPPPVPLPEMSEIAKPALNALGEPTLQSLGLGSYYTPPGWIQNGLEFLHVTFDLPWWGCIAITTVMLRILIFPIMLRSIKANIRFQNNMPELVRAQQKMTEAKRSGNMLEMTRATMEVQEATKKMSGAMFLAPLAQAPIFISMYRGLNRMATAPVESMTTGGMMWFTDLTVADPTYMLPLITASTVFITMELGAEGVSSNTLNPNMRWVMRLLPVIIFPLVMNFPTAMLCYWCTSNFFSLSQMLILKIPAVKAFLNIPVKVKHNPEDFKPKTFREGWRETMSNTKKITTLEERIREDARNFRRAGMGPIVKSYPLDSKKAKESLAARRSKGKH